MPGQAQLEDTVVAVNEADLDHCIAKPGDRSDVEATVRDLLTSYVANMGIDPLPHVAALDQVRVMDLIRQVADDATETPEVTCRESNQVPLCKGVPPSSPA